MSCQHFPLRGSNGDKLKLKDVLNCGKQSNIAATCENQWSGMLKSLLEFLFYKFLQSQILTVQSLSCV